MSRRHRRRKHIPRRACVACRTGRAKRELVRVVRTPEGAVMIDETGKRNGRGAYLCAQPSCWEKALGRKQLERALQVVLSAEAEAQMREYAAELPQPLSTIPLQGEEAAEGVC